MLPPANAEKLAFADDKPNGNEPTSTPGDNPASPWKVAVIDDDEIVHSVSRPVLADFKFKERPLILLDSYSGTKARRPQILLWCCLTKHSALPASAITAGTLKPTRRYSGGSQDSQRIAQTRRLPLHRQLWHRLFIDELFAPPEIGRSFVKDVTFSRDDAAIITLAHTMELEVIAEGVEIIEQLDFLVGSNCDAIQGYWYSPPLPCDEVEELLHREQTP